MRWHVLVIGGLICSTAFAQPDEVDRARLPAEKMPLADESLLLGAINTLQRTVVVGERGHILLSEDRQQWRQAQSVPTRSTLNAVTGIGSELWAVGHDAVIIHSTDGGENWELQQAKPAETAEEDPNPLLDVLFLDPQRGLAVGAYGRILRTDDGGQSWSDELIGDLITSVQETESDADEGGEGSGFDEDFEDFQDEYYDYHLNGIARLSDGTLFIAAEAGNGYRSTDEGESWIRVEFPYEGSMFGVLVTPDDNLIAYGLRGNVFRSGDGGLNWEQVETGSQNSLMGGTILDDGSVVLVGANGEVLMSRPGEADYRSYQHPDGGDLSDALPMTGDTVLIIGEDGIATYTPGASP